MTTTDEKSKKSNSTLKTIAVVAAGVTGVGLAYLLFRKKPAAETAATPPVPAPPVDTTKEPPVVEPTEPVSEKDIPDIYMAPHGVRVNTNALPLLTDKTSFSVHSPDASYSDSIGQIIHDASGATFKSARIDGEVVNGVAQQLDHMTGIGAIDGDPKTWFTDFMQRVTLADTNMHEELKAELAEDDMWVLYLPESQPVSVPLAMEYLKNFRKVIGPKRVLWVLDSDAPRSIAMALNESKEEWFRATDLSEDIKAGLDRLVTAPSMAEIAARFPAVTSTASIHP